MLPDTTSRPSLPPSPHLRSRHRDGHDREMRSQLLDVRGQEGDGHGFECPHPDCMKVAGHFIRQRNAPKPRKCTLSHVYGRDPKADEERREEKRILAEARRNRITTRSGEVLLPSALRRAPKRSPSPSAASNGGTRNTHDKGNTTSDFDMGATLNKDFAHDPARDSVMRMTGGRRRANGTFETGKQTADAGRMTVLTRGMSASQVATPEEQRTRRKKALKQSARSKLGQSESGPDLKETDSELRPKFESECWGCEEVIYGIRYHCFDCWDVDICWECFVDKSHGHALTHRFEKLAEPYDGRSEGPTMLKRKFCVCGSTSTSFLVLCSDCETPFHPGCIGVGAYERSQYGFDRMSRGTCMRHDHLNWKGGKVFRCEPCQELHGKGNVQTSRDLRMEERAKKQLEDAEKQEENGEKLGIVSSPAPKLKKRMSEELEDEPESRAREDQPASEVKRFRFDLAFRPKE